jgi:hypothetical protein
MPSLMFIIRDTAHHQFLEELAIHEDAVRATLVSLGQEELFTVWVVTAHLIYWSVNISSEDHC